MIKSLVGFRKSETEVKDLVLNVSSIQLETFGMHGSVAESFFLEIRRKLLQFYLNIEISTSLVTKLLQQASSEPVWSSPSSNSLDHPGHMGGSRGASPQSRLFSYQDFRFHAFYLKDTFI